MTLLFVDCCISQRETASRTAALCNAYLDSWKTAHPEGKVETLTLSRLNLKPFDIPMLNERDDLFRAGRLDHPVFALARQFAAADQILVGAPFWDLAFPALLRIYIEHISANGVTYCYDDEGPHGRCKARKLAYLTSGGDFERPGSNGVEYWKQLCDMYGIGAYESVFAGGLDADPSRTEEFMAAALAQAAALGGQ